VKPPDPKRNDDPARSRRMRMNPSPRQQADDVLDASVKDLEQLACAYVPRPPMPNTPPSWPASRPVID
jgi:hypothetical protein